MHETLWTGRFLEVRQRDTWEYVTRPNATSVVGIAAITDYQQIVLVEQFRKPLGRSVIELPAGLSGDDPASADEAPLIAAQRELLEETGYVAEVWTELMTGPSSAGLTDETVVLFLATGAHQQAAGGGVEGENITVHTVPIATVYKWLHDQISHGILVDFKVFAGLYFASQRQG